METLSINKDQSDKLTSIINGIHGLPFKFLGFNRGNRVSIKAFPPLLKMINQALSSVIFTPEIYKNWNSTTEQWDVCAAQEDKLTDCSQI